jgi:hypothetical protein
MLFLSLVAAELKRRGSAARAGGTALIGLGTRLRGKVRRLRPERSL